MLDHPIVDVALGLILLFSSLSLVASVVKEWVSSVLALRAKNPPEGDLARISHTVTAEGRWGSVGAEFLPREQVEQEQAALRPCFREARVAGTAA